MSEIDVTLSVSGVDGAFDTWNCCVDLDGTPAFDGTGHDPLMAAMNAIVGIIEYYEGKLGDV